MKNTDYVSLLNSFSVKVVYIWPFRKPIGLAEQRAHVAHLEVACSSADVSVTLFLRFVFAFVESLIPHVARWYSGASTDC